MRPDCAGCFGHQPLMLFVTLATICLSVYLYVVMPKGFFPQVDSGLIQGGILGAQDVSFASMQQKLKQYTDIVMSDPAVKSMMANTGGGAENTGRMEFELKPLSERKVSANQVIARLRRKASNACRSIRAASRRSAALPRALADRLLLQVRDLASRNWALAPAIRRAAARPTGPVQAREAADSH